MIIMVILSQPTPPVSELDARQLSIIFSQILSSSCLAAMPRLTNSITACEDWQSQMPTRARESEIRCCEASKAGGRPTVACNDEKLVVIAQIMDDNVRVRCDDLLFWRQLRALLEFEVPNGP